MISENINTLKQIPGVGLKSAQRIILELKDKLKKEQQVKEITNANVKVKSKQIIVEDNKEQEAISALQVLGYQRKDIEKVIQQLNLQELDLEDIIRQALKML